MRDMNILHRFLKKTVPQMHVYRRKSLSTCISPLLDGSIISVTELGRNLRTDAKTKHNIKRVDRLLSNERLQGETQIVYQAITRYLCKNNSRPIILIDWSDLVERDRTLVIRAAIALKGRAVTLLEKAYPLEKYNKPATHKAFLRLLKVALPPNVIPVIVTDAGFRGPWFREVESHGWSWVGRIRNCIKYRLATDDEWKTAYSLYPKATATPKFIGDSVLSHKRPYDCYLYLYKKKKAGRKARRTTHAFRRHAKESGFKKQQKEPWLLATNIPPCEFGAPDIIRIYSKRMQIEECFRDLKSHRSGFGFNFCLSRKIERINVLLLMAALASLCLWWIGIAAEKKDLQYRFQANTTRHKRVLSTLFVAKLVVQRHDLAVPINEIVQAFQELPNRIREAAKC